MVAAYKKMLEFSSWSKDALWSAIEIAGLSDSKAFGKKFKALFGVSPMKAFKNKDLTLITAVRDWDIITAEGKSGFVKFGESDMEETKFGISKDKYMIANIAANLQAFYNLNDIESELAFELYNKKKYNMEDTFEYVYNYMWNYLNEESPNRDIRLHQDLLRPDVIYMYFECGMSFNEIIHVLITLKKNELPRKLEEADKKYLLGFVTYCKEYEPNKEIILDCGQISYTYEALYKKFNNIVLKIANKKKNHMNTGNIDTEINFIKFIKWYADIWQESFIGEDERDQIGYYDYPYDEEYDFSEYGDLFEYEPDFDDPDIIEELFINNYESEVENNFINNIQDLESIFGYNELDLDAFEKFCDELDSEIEERTDESRKLTDYKDLDVETILKEIDREIKEMLCD